MVLKVMSAIAGLVVLIAVGNAFVQAGIKEERAEQETLCANYRTLFEKSRTGAWRESVAECEERGM